MHSEICPVCSSEGKLCVGLTQSAVCYGLPVLKTCHGCGGRGWVVVPDTLTHIDNPQLPPTQ